VQYLITALDGKDSQAEQRRADARPAHLELGDKMKAAGQLLYAAALLNEAQKMIGSVLICEFSSQDALDDWLKVEPYVTGAVWKEINIQPCKVGPSFAPKPSVT
jgi:uncharacterized protein